MEIPYLENDQNNSKPPKIDLIHIVPLETIANIFSITKPEVINQKIKGLLKVGKKNPPFYNAHIILMLKRCFERRIFEARATKSAIKVSKKKKKKLFIKKNGIFNSIPITFLIVGILEYKVGIKKKKIIFGILEFKKKKKSKIHFFFFNKKNTFSKNG